MKCPHEIVPSFVRVYFSPQSAIVCDEAYDDCVDHEVSIGADDAFTLAIWRDFRPTKFEKLGVPFKCGTLLQCVDSELRRTRRQMKRGQGGSVKINRKMNF